MADNSTTVVTHREPKIQYYFNKDIPDLQVELQAYVDKMGEEIKIANAISEEYTFDINSGDNQAAFVYGRLYATYFDEDDATSAKERFSLQSAEIQLTKKFPFPSLKFIPPPSLEIGMFRGEVIAVKGAIHDGSLYAQEIFSDSRAKKPSEIDTKAEKSIVVVRGPYFESNTSEVDDICAKIHQIPNVYPIFIGPFVMSECPILKDPKCSHTAEELTMEVITKLTRDFQVSSIVGSADDAYGFPLLPSPHMLDDGGNYNVASDPTTFICGGASIFVTSFNIPLSMSLQYDGPSDGKPMKFAKLIAHQCSACPVADSIVQAQYISELQPSEPPHVFVCPTQFQEICEAIDQTYVVCMKPYQKTKHFLLVQIHDGQISLSFHE